MAFIFTNLPDHMAGRRAGLEAYLQQLDTADQEQLATDSSITFTPAADIDVATAENYTFLAVNADAATAMDYAGVNADVRDQYEEQAIADMLPENKWTVAQGSAIADKTGPVFAVTTEVAYLTLMVSKYPGWAHMVIEPAVTVGIRDAQKELFIMKMSGEAKNRIAGSIPTASYVADAATGLFSIASDVEYAGMITQVDAIIKKVK